MMIKEELLVKEERQKQRRLEHQLFLSIGHIGDTWHDSNLCSTASH